MATNTSKRPLNEIHLKIAKKISEGRKMETRATDGFFRMGRSRWWNAPFLLDELRNEGIIDANNNLTSSGVLWVIINS